MSADEVLWVDHWRCSRCGEEWSIERTRYENPNLAGASGGRIFVERVRRGRALTMTHTCRGRQLGIAHLVGGGPPLSELELLGELGKELPDDQK